MYKKLLLNENKALNRLYLSLYFISGVYGGIQDKKHGGSHTFFIFLLLKTFETPVREGPGGRGD